MTGMEHDPLTGVPEPNLIIDLRSTPSADEPLHDGYVPNAVDLRESESTGTMYLKERYPDAAEKQAANYAMAIVITIKHTEAEMSTGMDVSTLGIPSQQLLGDVLLRLPIGVLPPDPAGDMVFDEFVKDIGLATSDEFSALIVEFLRASNDYRLYFGARSDVENKATRDHLRPLISEIQYLAETYVDKVLTDNKLPHEGGQHEVFEPEMLQELCDPSYLRAVFGGNQDIYRRTGFRGENIMRLMNEARHLDIVGAREMSLQ